MFLEFRTKDKISCLVNADNIISVYPVGLDQSKLYLIDENILFLNESFSDVCAKLLDVEAKKSRTKKD